MPPEASNDFTLIARMLSDGFNRLDIAIDSLRRSLDGKADISRVAALEAKLAEAEVRSEDWRSKLAETIDMRFRPLEETQTEGKALGRLGMWLIGTIGVAVFLACTTILSALISGRHL